MFLTYLASNRYELDQTMRKNTPLEITDIKEHFNNLQKYNRYLGRCQLVKVMYNRFRVVQATIENFYLAATALLILFFGSPKFKRDVASNFSQFLNRIYDQHPLADERKIPGMVTKFFNSAYIFF